MIYWPNFTSGSLVQQQRMHQKSRKKNQHLSQFKRLKRNRKRMLSEPTNT